MNKTIEFIRFISGKNLSNDIIKILSDKPNVTARYLSDTLYAETTTCNGILNKLKEFGVVSVNNTQSSKEYNLNKEEYVYLINEFSFHQEELIKMKY